MLTLRESSLHLLKLLIVQRLKENPEVALRAEP
jgi:hypothetical protein